MKYLVNTHWHFDHSDGNENLGKAGVTIIAHDNVRVRMAAGATVAGFTAPPAPPAALPVVTYEDGISLHLNGDRIDAITTGGGHTDGDTALYWRKANVIHTGDLMMNGLGFFLHRCQFGRQCTSPDQDARPSGQGHQCRNQGDPRPRPGVHAG